MKTNRDETVNGKFGLGLTKRELFAAFAMIGIEASSALDPELVAKKALETADALILELNK